MPQVVIILEMSFTEPTGLFLGKSHLRHAIFCHEQALQTHSLCKISRTIDVLKVRMLILCSSKVKRYCSRDVHGNFLRSRGSQH